MLSRVDTNLFFLSFFFSICHSVLGFLGIEFCDCFQLDKCFFCSGCYNLFFYKKFVHLFLFSFLLYN
jgi:hypothetical protein